MYVKCTQAHDLTQLFNFLVLYLQRLCRLYMQVVNFVEITVLARAVAHAIVLPYICKHVRFRVYLQSI